MDMRIKRHDLRIIALSALFCWELGGGSPEEVFDAVMGILGIEEGRGGSGTTYGYARELFTAAVEHAGELDRAIAGASLGWSVSRMPKVDLCILRLALTEVIHLRSSPLEVSINEACELAREFSTHASPRFVNGVLMGIFRETGHVGSVEDSVE